MNGLRVLLLVAVLAIAGCRQQLDSGTLRAAGDWAPPPVYHGNPFGFGGVGAAYHFVFEPLFSYIPATGEWLPRLAERFEESGDTTTVYLRPEATWHDGSGVTAEDVRASLLLLVLRGHPLAEFCAQLEVVDRHTLRFHWRYRTEDLKALVFAELIFLPADRFPGPLQVMEEFVERGLSRERDAPEVLRSRMEEARLELLRERPQFPMGTGPFRMTKVTASEMLFEKFAQHPLAERLPYHTLRLFKMGSNEVGWALLLSGEVDFVAMSCPIDLVEEIKRRQPRMQVALPEDGHEVGFIFNTRVLDRTLREALVCVLDRDTVRMVAFPFADTADDVGLGVISSRRASWFSTEELAAFAPRPTDLRQAERLLTEGGYRKQQGRWQTADGRALELTVTCRSGYSDFIVMAEAAAAQWDAFGIPTKIRVVQPDIYPTLLSDGDFDITAAFGVMHGRFATPVAGLERFFYRGNELQEAMGLPKLVEVEGQRIDPDRTVRALRYEQDPTKLRRQVFLLAKVLYDQVVYVPIFEKRNPMFALEGAAVPNWPAPDHPYWSGVVVGAEQTFLNMLLFTETGEGKP